MAQVYSDEISLSSPLRDTSGYSLQTLRRDAWAGLSVALLTLPQSMAYALLAGLPLSCGLFAAIYSAFIAALFGSSRHLIVGPSNAIALLIQSGTSEVLLSYYHGIPVEEQGRVALQILTQLSFLVAILQIAAAWCRLGRLIQFVSKSVITGYIAGAALAMISNQLFAFFGITQQAGPRSLYERLSYLLTHIHHLQIPATLVGISSFVLLVIIKRWKPHWPAAVIMLTIISSIVGLAGLSSYSDSSIFASFIYYDGYLPDVTVVGDTGEVYELFPEFSLPYFNLRTLNGILPVAFAIALLGVIETSSVVKALASYSGQRTTVNQELFGLGLGNLASACLGAMPISGNPIRSGVNYRSGAQTHFAAVFNALFVALIVFSLGFFVMRIPLAALSALLLVTAFSLVDIKQFAMCAKATGGDAFVLWATLLSCIFFSLDVAFYIGVLLSITLYLKNAAMPQLVEYTIAPSGELHLLDPSEARQKRTVRVIKVEGELFFGAADLFHTTLKAITEDDTSTRVIILQLKNARDVDATVCFALQQLHKYLMGSGRHLIACGIMPQTWEVFSSSGLVNELDKRNLFVFDERHPLQHMQRASARANELAGETAKPCAAEIIGLQSCDGKNSTPSLCEGRV